ncbi:MAG TPA: rhomboid family intramembrane serine protease [Anaeromyxobacteraceae bacterium]|nr:rhomboid family intramembrane serine protease [Anaeromyxobacteraceae bacterium]
MTWLTPKFPRRAPDVQVEEDDRSHRVLPLHDDLPTRRIPYITILLVAANVAAFAWQVTVAGMERSVLEGGVIPYEILTLQDTWPRDLLPPPFTILTAMFLHGGLGHLGSNLLFLWIFGNNVEDVMGRLRFAGFYLACGVAAAGVQVFASAAAGNVEAPMVGASGAIAGVLAAYLRLFPGARVLTLAFVFLVWLPAWLVLGLWILTQIVAVLSGGAPGVALFAHIGGFATGWVLVDRFLPPRLRRDSGLPPRP